jgi:hypothetical protein
VERLERLVVHSPLAATAPPQADTEEFENVRADEERTQQQEKTVYRDPRGEPVSYSFGGKLRNAQKKAVRSRPD